MKSWMDIPADSDFSIHNIPFGIFSCEGPKKIGAAIGNYVLDVHAMYVHGFFSEFSHENVYLNSYLNDFIDLGKVITSTIRKKIQHELCNESSPLRKDFSTFFIPSRDVTLHLPINIRDYTDFYSSEHHAKNVGAIFRKNNPELPPNWLHMPIAYCGRASSIVVSNTKIICPKGQYLKDGEPVHDYSQCIDFELEMATIIGKKNALGSPVQCSKAMEHVFGFALFNDWSARDMQRWEYQPLGPFTGKSFASSISPWIVTTEALAPFIINKQKRATDLPYLQSENLHTYDINMFVHLNNNLVTATNFKHLHWTPAQQIAHHTVNGCNLNTGDVLASGTISGPEKLGKGSMLEITKSGQSPLILSDGTERAFLQVNDYLSFSACANFNGIKVGFGLNNGTLIKTTP